MTTQTPGKIGRYVLWFSPLVIVPTLFLLLKQRNPAVTSILGPAAAIFVMAYSIFIARAMQRRLDEVQVAGQGVAIHHGWVWGMMVTVLLLMLPPVTNWLIDLANMQSTGSPDISDRRAVRLALIYGFCLVALVQTMGIFVASTIWWSRMGRMRERS